MRKSVRLFLPLITHHSSLITSLMIERYTLPEMGALWSEQNKFRKWLDVEVAVCEVHAEMGTIPREAVEEIKSKAAFTVERIREIEQTTDHDVIAFTTALAESIGDAARFVHYGLTSSDVVDTANALLLRDSCGLLLEKTGALMEVLKRRAFELRTTPQVGRTHGDRKSTRLNSSHDQISYAVFCLK